MFIEWYIISGGFYRHLYSQKIGDDKCKSDVSESSTKSKCDSDKISRTQNRKRHYRQRSLTPEIENATDPVEDLHEGNKQHLQSNLDADSDFSIDSSDSEQENGEDKQTVTIASQELNTGDQVEIKQEKQDENDVKSQIPQWNEGFKIPERIKREEESKPVIEVKKPKIDIWKKRTVDDVFLEAQLRYYNRKSLRQCAF